MTCLYIRVCIVRFNDQRAFEHYSFSRDITVNWNQTKSACTLGIYTVYSFTCTGNFVTVTLHEDNFITIAHLILTYTFKTVIQSTSITEIEYNCLSDTWLLVLCQPLSYILDMVSSSRVTKIHTYCVSLSFAKVL